MKPKEVQLYLPAHLSHARLSSRVVFSPPQQLRQTLVLGPETERKIPAQMVFPHVQR